MYSRACSLGGDLSSEEKRRRAYGSPELLSVLFLLSWTLLSSLFLLFAFEISPSAFAIGSIQCERPQSRRDAAFTYHGTYDDCSQASSERRSIDQKETRVSSPLLLFVTPRQRLYTPDPFSLLVLPLVLFQRTAAASGARRQRGRFPAARRGWPCQVFLFSADSMHPKDCSRR